MARDKSTLHNDRYHHALLEFAVSQSSAIFYIAELEGDSAIQFISANVEAITGHKPGDFLEDADFGYRHIHPNDIDGYLADLGRLAELGSLSHDYRFKNSRGEYRLFRDELRLLDNPNGRLEFIACMTDITDQMTAEEENRRLSNLLHDAIESLPTGIAIFDAADQLNICNQAFSDVLKKDPRQLVGLQAESLMRQFLENTTIFDTQRIDDAEAALPEAFERIWGSKGEPIEVQLKSDRWLQVTNHTLPSGGRVAVRTDITHLKAVEDSLRESEDRFRSIVEANPSPVRVTDHATWEILYESPASAALFGHAWPTEPGLTTFDTYPDEAERERITTLLDEQGYLDGYELQLRRKDGSLFWAAISTRMVSQEDRTICVTSLVDLTESKNREAELREAREILEDAIESLSDGFILYDTEDRLLLCNSQYKAFHTGCDDLLVPGAYWPIVTKERAERGFFMPAIGREDSYVDEVMGRRGTTQNVEFETHEGRWFENSHRKTRHGGFVSTWREITERKTMEQALRESEALVRVVLESCPVPARMWNPDSGEIYYESPACKEMLLRDFTKVSVEERQEVYVDLKDRERYLAKLKETGAVNGMEMQLRRGDGSIFWVAASARLTEFRNESVIVSNLVDLSEAKEREQALRQAREILEDAIEALPEGFALFGADDKLLLCNGRFKDFNALSADVLKPGVTWHEFIRAGAERGQYCDAEGRVEEWLAERFRYKSLGTGKPGGVEFQQNDDRWYHGFSQPTRQGGYVGIRVDITERRAAEAELARQREMLHQSEKLSALGELLAGVSHELNNPLSVLLGQALMLRETASDEKTAQRAEKISNAADRCARIVKSFLAMARQEPSQSEPLDLNEVIDESLEVTAYSLRATGVEVALDLAEDLPVISANADQMRQLFINLIVNAEHALQDVEGERRLGITTTHQPRRNHIVVTVKDSGPGVPADIRSRIFEPLYTTKEVGSGTGMGLALCHRIVEAHGGTVTVESGPGEGACFSIRLPVRTAQDSLVANEAKTSSENEPYRVLVVDDDFDVGQIISDVLQSDGHSVEVVKSGIDALDRLKQADYHVILSDIRMPKMDGPAFYRALQELDSRHASRLAFITGDTLSPRVKDFLDSSGRPFLEKPIRPRDIRDLLDRLTRAAGV